VPRDRQQLAVARDDEADAAAGGGFARSLETAVLS